MDIDVDGDGDLADLPLTHTPRVETATTTRRSGRASKVAGYVADPSLDGWHMFGGNAQKNGMITPPAPTRPAELGAAKDITFGP